MREWAVSQTGGAMKIHVFKRTLWLLFIFLSLSPNIAQSASTPSPAASQPDWAKMSPEALKVGIEGFHPAAYYILASKLFTRGQKDEAVFWFYLGQLRYRFHLEANPDLNPSADPALFASLSETVGRPINEYAFGDIPTLVKTIDAVLKWDEIHDNGFTAKTAHSQAWKKIREGLLKMRAYLLEKQEEIKQQRTAHGLKNR